MLIMSMEEMIGPQEPEAKKVPDGKTHYQNIFELESHFDNSSFKQGSKFSMEQRMKTSGY